MKYAATVRLDREKEEGFIGENTEKVVGLRDTNKISWVVMLIR